jgi:proteic killer suppression protein
MPRWQLRTSTFHRAIGLKGLRGNREGQHSIRVNNPYRIRFIWRDGNAREVEIVDYH